MRSSNVFGASRFTRAADIMSASLMLVLLGGIQIVQADHLPVHGTILARGPFTDEIDVKVKARAETTWSSSRSTGRPTRSSSRSRSSRTGSRAGTRTPDRPP